MLTNSTQEGSCTKKKKIIVWGEVQKHQYICTNSPHAKSCVVTQNVLRHMGCCMFCWQVRNTELREFTYLIATKFAPSLGRDILAICLHNPERWPGKDFILLAF